MSSTAPKPASKASPSPSPAQTTSALRSTSPPPPPRGGYHFTNLRPGTYTVTETHPTGYLDGPDDLGTPVNVATTTDLAGGYDFTNLRPGTYTVTETHPTGYLDGIDTAGTAGGTTANDTITNITLTPGQTATAYTFGELASTSISGRVFVDGDNDGIDAAATASPE